MSSLSDRRADHVSTGAGGSSGSGDQDLGGLREQKKAMRKSIKSELKAISEEAAGAASAAVAERLLAFPELEKKSSGGGGASVYLSMPGELGTAAVVSGLFKLGWKVYIPKVRFDRGSSPQAARVALPCQLLLCTVLLWTMPNGHDTVLRGAAYRGGALQKWACSCSKLLMLLATERCLADTATATTSLESTSRACATFQYNQIIPYGRGHHALCHHPFTLLHIYQLIGFQRPSELESVPF